MRTKVAGHGSLVEWGCRTERNTISRFKFSRFNITVIVWIYNDGWELTGYRVRSYSSLFKIEKIPTYFLVNH